MAKIRKIISFEKLDTDVQRALNEKYPYGWRNDIRKIEKGNGPCFYAISFDYDEFSYLIKVDVKIDFLSDLEKEEKKLDNEGIPMKTRKVEFNDEENYEDGPS